MSIYILVLALGLLWMAILYSVISLEPFIKEFPKLQEQTQNVSSTGQLTRQARNETNWRAVCFTSSPLLDSSIWRIFYECNKFQSHERG